ncbi:ribosomal protein L7/L12 [Streptomyces sp. T-3]|nr:ribosomal protein L7/L12 [Streptomyces sp. T-3]
MEIAVFVMVFAVLLAGGSIEYKIKQTNRRMARLEGKVDLILDHLGLRTSDPELNEVVALAQDGKKIQAIKVYREITGADLKDAKDAVDRLVP